MPYGIVFQEFHQKWFNTFGEEGQRRIDRGSMVRLTWILVAFLMAMAYSSNLKASLVSKAYEPSIRSIDEMIEKLGGYYCSSSTFIFPLFSWLHVLEMIDRVVSKGGATLFYAEITNLFKFPITTIPEL